MIDADQLEILADKASLEIERSLEGIPFRHATEHQLSLLEEFGNSCEVELGHMMDYNVLFAIYLRHMAKGLAQYLMQIGSGEYILYDRVPSDPKVHQRTSTQNFPCRVTLTKDSERGIVNLDICAFNYKPGELPAEFTGV